MRISTNMLFQNGSSRLSELQSAMSKTQEQIATGRRVLTPSDDPVAAAQALNLSQAKAINEQFAVNRGAARHNLNMQEQALQSVTLLIQDVQTMVVGAGNGTLDTPQRQFMATELRGRLDDLLGLANTTDGAGSYLFAGYQTGTQPFTRAADGIRYNGDQGQRSLQVGPSRMIQLSDTGTAVFDGIRTGNGIVAVSAAAGNQGTGTIEIGNTASQLPSTSYEIRFVSATEYDVYDTGVDPAVQLAPANRPYVSGQEIALPEDGANPAWHVSVEGQPAVGDSFSVEPSSEQSVFATLQNLIAVLETPANGGPGRAALANGLYEASANLGHALDSVLTTRASVGARLRELDSLDEQGSARDIQYQATLAELQEVDYTKAITDLTKQQIILQAAQQSFVKTSGLSLFNFM